MFFASSEFKAKHIPICESLVQIQYQTVGCKNDRSFASSVWHVNKCISCLSWSHELISGLKTRKGKRIEREEGKVKRSWSGHVWVHLQGQLWPGKLKCNNTDYQSLCKITSKTIFRNIAITSSYTINDLGNILREQQLDYNYDKLICHATYFPFGT